MTASRPLWFEAAAVAARAHEHQCRRDGRTPYVAHPFRVALTVACRFGCTDERVLAAAILHDVIEDGTVDYDDLLETFGSDVADIVSALSKDKRKKERVREAAYRKRLEEASWQVRLIKLADVHDNLIDVADEAGRAKLLGKAAEALAMAGSDPELADARRVVSALVEAVRSGEYVRADGGTR